MGNTNRTTGKKRYPIIAAAGTVFTLLWLSLLPNHSGVIDQLTQGVTGSIRHHFRHRQGKEGVLGHARPTDGIMTVVTQWSA